MTRSLRRIPARTSLVYAAVAGLWIVGSDRVLSMVVADPAAASAIQTYKGWFFVACTAALLYVTLRAEVVRFTAESAARREAEVALERSEALYRAIARNLPGGAVSVVDSRLEPMLDEGPLVSELGREALGDVAGAAAPGHAAPGELFRRALSGEVLSAEQRIGERSIWARFVPLLGDGGAVLGAMRLALDVTPRERIERELRAAEERLRQVVESIREVFWLRDVRRGEFEYVSPAFEAVWGRSCASLIAAPGEWLESIHVEDRERVAQLGVGSDGRDGYDLEYRIVRPDGSVRWVRDQAFPVRDGTGEVVRVTGVAEDVSERRVLLEQLQQTQRLESIGLLAGGVAHDFNNLLTVISGNIELLLPALDGDGELHAIATDIQRAGERAGSLTRQLLAFSRREVLEPRVLDPNAVVLETEKMLRRLLGEDIELTTRLSPRRDYVRVDPGHLVQVLMNLAVNARDAMPRGGRLSIETATVIRDESYARVHPRVEPGPYVELTVSDTGSGMSDEVRKRAFEPFFTTKGQGRGTGLGLAVVHGIVEQSGGHLRLEAEPGVGTTFRMYFPVVADIRAALRADGDAAPRGHEAVLVVEDDESVRRLAERGLTSFGYAVTVASGAAEALMLLDRKRDPFAILVTDVVMPGLDGRELADAARARLPSIRVLFTSGYTDDDVVRRGVLQSEVPFLQKPYTAVALARKLRETLDRR